MHGSRVRALWLNALMLLFYVSVKGGVAEVRLAAATALKVAAFVIVLASSTVFRFRRFTHRAAISVIAIFIVGVLLTIGVFGLGLLHSTLELNVVHFKLN